jgi:hypothetical protein
MNVEIGTENPIFLFWEYFFRNIGILSLQCISQYFVTGSSNIVILATMQILIYTRAIDVLSAGSIPLVRLKLKIIISW